MTQRTLWPDLPPDVAALLAAHGLAVVSDGDGWHRWRLDGLDSPAWFGAVEGVAEWARRALTPQRPAGEAVGAS